MKKKTEKRPQTKISILLQLFMAVMFFTGAAVFTYPFLADALSNYLDQRRIENYQKQLAREKEEKNEQRLAVQEKKNQALDRTAAIPGMGQVKDPFEQAVRDVRNPGKEYYEQHMIGAIYIPKINVSLPLFDETNDLLLDIEERQFYKVPLFQLEEKVHIPSLPPIAVLLRKNCLQILKKWRKMTVSILKYMVVCSLMKSLRKSLSFQQKQIH